MATPQILARKFTLIFAGLLLAAGSSSLADSLTVDSTTLYRAAGKSIRSIQFEGKFKLRRSILYREIDSKPGCALDPKILERDERKIDGLGIFSRVDATVVEEADSVDIKFQLREVWTLLPLISLGTTDGKLDWAIGAHERNLLGLYVQAAALYRRYEGKNSGSLSMVFPRFLGQDFSVGIGISQRKEIDPLSYHGVSYDYDYLAKAVSGSIGYRLAEGVYGYGSGGYDRENWQLQSPDTMGIAINNIDYPRYFASIGVLLGRVYAKQYFLNGQDLSADLALIHEQPDGRFNKWRLGLTGRKYIIWRSFNLAMRSRVQFSSRDERVPPYSISGEANVRGYADKYERGDAAIFGNAEIRWKYLDRKVFYSQLAGFTDFGAIWGRRKDFEDAIADPHWSVGIGMRGAIRQFLGRIGRVDLAFSPETHSFAVYVSASQFF